MRHALQEAEQDGVGAKLPLAAPLSSSPGLNASDRVFMGGGGVRGLDDTQGPARSRPSESIHMLHIPPNA